MSIEELEKTLNGGTRSSKYRLNFTLPNGVGGDVRTLQILAKSTTLPGKDRGQIEIKKLGKTRRIKGDDVTTSTWNCTFQLSSKPQEIIKTMHEWYDLEDESAYKVTMTADLLDLQNEVTFTYKLEGVFVLNLPTIAVSSEDTDTLLEYDVTFSVDNINAAE